MDKNKTRITAASSSFEEEEHIIKEQQQQQEQQQKQCRQGKRVSSLVSVKPNTHLR